MLNTSVIGDIKLYTLFNKVKIVFNWTYVTKHYTLFADCQFYFCGAKVRF